MLASLYFNQMSNEMIFDSVYIKFPSALKQKVVYSWSDFHSDQVRIPFPSASKKSKSALVGQSKGRSLQYIAQNTMKVIN